MLEIQYTGHNFDITTLVVSFLDQIFYVQLEQYFKQSVIATTNQNSQ